MTTITIEQPAAWCLVPLQHTDLVVDPDIADGRTSSESDSTLNWLLIATTVSTAVRHVQKALSDPLARDRSVATARAVRRRGVAARRVLARVRSGDQRGRERHRTWYSRLAGAAEVPVINSPFGDAIDDWQADPTMFRIADHGSLAEWHRERRWWDGKAAVEWARGNGRHLSLWDAALQRWKRRLGPRADRT